MHRSGTSALARVMSLLGADLPRRVLPANRGNPDGYWEPEAVVALNDDILADRGTRWDDPFARSHLASPEGIPARFMDRAVSLIAEEYGNSRLCVLKDPRCTLLADFWREALARSGFESVPVLVLRPPHEVVDSLRRRDGTLPGAAMLSYVAHALAAIDTCLRHRGSFTTYGQLTSDWSGVAARIADEQGLSWPVPAARARDAIDAFLHKPGKKAPRHDVPPQVEQWAEAAWARARALAEGRAVRGSLDDVAREFEALAELLSPLTGEHARQLGESAGRLEAQRQETARVHALFEESQATLARAARDRDLAQELQRHHEEAAERIRNDYEARLRETVRERDGFELDRNRVLELHARLEQENASLAVQRGEFEADRNRALQAYAELEAGHAALAAQRDELEGDRNRALEAYAGLEAGHAALAVQRNELEADRNRALEVYAKLEAEHAALAVQRNELEADRNRALGVYAKLEAEHAALAVQRDELIDERDRALEAYSKLEAEHAALAVQRDELEADRARLLERHASLEAEHVALATQRDELEADRNRVLALYRSIQDEMGTTMDRIDQLAREVSRLAEHATQARDQSSFFREERDNLRIERDRIALERESLSKELAQQGEATRQALARAEDLDGRLRAIEEERNRLADELASQGQATVNAEARADALAVRLQSLQQERDDILRQHQELCAMHADVLRRLDVARQQASETREGLAMREAELSQLRASSSWRMTAPLRGIRRMVSGSGRPAPRLPANDPLPPRPREEAGSDDIVGAREASDRVGRHPGLAHFLHEEYGTATMHGVLGLVEGYGLPVDTSEGRAASDVPCETGQAVAWAQELAALAADSPVMARERVPDVSIIVPVYNQVRFTLACLHALLLQDSRYAIEVIVGDDRSSDATAEALAVDIPGVRVIRHDENLGFVRNCNAAAAHARGRYVVFLNNDTLVLPRWLDELVGTLDRDPGIGLAGSKLVFPDGRMQECGAIVWQDGSAWNFGRLDDPRKPEYSYLRDTDYVSGASIALSRDLWERLGGFDEAYVPAYAEDADLAFRIREEGLRTVVQPTSQLLHFEGVTSGTDTTQGAKAYQVRNLQTLHARWADRMAAHRPNAVQPALEKERGVAGRVLFIDHCTPTPDEDAGSLVAWEVMAAFRAHGYKVTFIPEDNFAHMGEATRVLQRVGIEPIFHPAYSNMAQFLEARDDPFDFVFLHRYRVGEKHMAALRRRYPGAKVIFLNADMHFLREQREAELSGDPEALVAAARTREQELSVVRAADLALVHSEAELALLRDHCPEAQASLFPLIHDPVDRVAPLENRSGIGFVGGFRHPPNADGIAWFVREVWPLVRREHPDATLHVAGSHMPAEVQALSSEPGVVVEGFVPDLASFLDARRASVAPLRYGAGAKGKVAASLAHGLPVASTTVGAEGMGLQPGVNVLVGDAPEDLARHIGTLLDDDARWHALSAEGLRYAGEVTSRAMARSRVASYLELLGGPERA